MVFYSGLTVIGIFTVASAIAIIGSTDLPFYPGGLPGPGLWPFSLAVLLLVLCLLDLLERKALKEFNWKTKVDKDSLKRLVLFSVLLVVMPIWGTLTIGMLPSLALYLFVSLFIWYHLTLKVSIGVVVILVGSIGLLFSLFLNVRFPMGMLS